MPDVFTDEVGTYDLTITTSADWTISSGGMPNGDNYATPDGSVAATYNVNGDEFDLRDGTAWTIEFWFYYTTAGSGIQAILVANDVGTSTSYWQVTFTAAEAVQFGIVNTTGSFYLSQASATLSTSTWHHLVCVKETGNTVKMYVDNGAPGSSSATSGTARTPGANTRIYLGTMGDGTLDLGTTAGARIAKVAIYNRELSSAEVNDHYLAMTAA